MKNSKLYFALLLVISLMYMACGGKKADAAADQSATAATPTTPDAAPVNEAGKKTFETYCILCHGADGRLGLNGSKDLSISIITLEERINQVTNGKGQMTPFKDILTADEIKSVAEYTQSLKQ
ncbi:MAG: cytochrome c [Saprospiraceae bacterium]